MAILRDKDGLFYNVPDESLDSMLVPADQVKSKLSAAASSLPARAQGPNGEDTVTPNGSGWCRNCWHNCWSRNCWHNCY